MVLFSLKVYTYICTLMSSVRINSIKNDITDMLADSISFVPVLICVQMTEQLKKSNSVSYTEILILHIQKYYFVYISTIIKQVPTCYPRSHFCSQMNRSKFVFDTFIPDISLQNVKYKRNYALSPWHPQ